MYFRPMSQLNTTIKERSAITAETRSLFPNSITLRYAGDAASLEPLVRHTLANINPNLTVLDFKSLDYQVAGNFNQERLISRLTTLFGMLALVLASVGLYGITAYSVARRTSEIGLRMALGANRTDVVALVLRAASWQVGLGLAIGIPVALLGGRLMSSSTLRRAHLRSTDDRRRSPGPLRLRRHRRIHPRKTRRQHRTHERPPHRIIPTESVGTGASPVPPSAARRAAPQLRPVRGYFARGKLWEKGKMSPPRRVEFDPPSSQ